MAEARSIIAIGASAGGVSALRALTAKLPETLSAPILIVLHVGAHPSELPNRLNAAGPIYAKHAEDGEMVQATLWSTLCTAPSQMFELRRGALDQGQ